MPVKPLVLLRRRWFRLACIFSAALVLFWLGSSLLCVYLLTRRACPPFAETAPAVAWGRVEALRLATGDGQELGAGGLMARV